jgi:hypothetical protein
MARLFLFFCSFPAYLLTSLPTYPLTRLHAANSAPTGASIWSNEVKAPA